MPNRFQIHGLLRHEILHGQSLGNALTSHGPATPGSRWFQMCLSKAHQVLCLCTLYSISTCLYIIYSISNIYIYMYRIRIEYYRSLICTYIYYISSITTLPLAPQSVCPFQVAFAADLSAVGAPQSPCRPHKSGNHAIIWGHHYRYEDMNGYIDGICFSYHTMFGFAPKCGILQIAISMVKVMINQWIWGYLIFRQIQVIQVPCR